jgi:hypothetical protein
VALDRGPFFDPSQKNQEVQCPSPFSVAYSSLGVQLNRIACVGFKKCHISIAMDGTDEDMLWNDSGEDGNIRSGCEEDEGTSSEEERATLGDEHNLTSFLYEVY